MASMDLRTLPFRAPIPQRNNFCHGPTKVSVRIIIISASNSYGRRRNAILRPLLVSNTGPVGLRPLLVSNAGPVGSLLDTGIQLVKNLKNFPEFKIRASRDSLFPGYDDFVANLMPAVNSFDIFAASLGFLAGLAVHVFRSQRPQLAEPRGATADDWVLFANPTPFNRFVVLRCPSIVFEDGAFLENVNDKLMKDSKHFVNLSGYSCKVKTPNTDGIGFRDKNEGESEFMYQRICLSAEDGGVITLDWPASLDLAREQGLDSTLLLVPGTAEGSNDELVQDFVRKALQHGCFPVVMNPRGCAGSPLTTPRLFTAADSDDLYIAAQFIARLRPWSTLMGVGWGYGANILTKYLGEASETTPLAAAVSIGNPFDLDEATRSLSHYSLLDRKFVEGLKDILQRNKALFQGRKKGFDISKALSATSVREFEMAISRVAHGCDTIESFYAKSSSRETIKRVKIPVLFIQNDDIMAPPFSVPRNTIEDNPFTSLLMHSSMPTRYANASGWNATKQWCENLVIEWLVAVELALLKGRHPLLKDIDINIKPTNGLIIKRHLPAAKRMTVHGVQNHAIDSALGTNADKFLDSNDREASVFNGIQVNGEDRGHKSKLKNRSASLNMVQQNGHEEITNTELEKGKPMGLSKEGYSTEAAGTVEESQSGQEEVERGQVLQTAETIMRMLDVTMPGTLADEQRQQVLNAVGRGETLITALQGAVPEEVCGKLTAAVSGAVQAQGINLKLTGLGKGFPMDMKSNSQGKSLEDNVKVEGNGMDNFPGLEGKFSEGENAAEADTTRQREMVDIKSNAEGLDVHQNEEVLQNAHMKTNTEEKSSNSGLETPKVDSNISEQVGGNSSPGKKIQEDMQENPLRNEVREKSNEGNEGIDNQYQQQKSEKSDGSEVCTDEQHKGKENTVKMDGKFTSEQYLKEESTPDPKNDDKSMRSAGDQSKQNSEAKIDEPSYQVGTGVYEQNKGKENTEPDGKSAGEQMSKREGISDLKNDEKSMNSEGDQNKQSSDTKIDDSTPQGGPSSVQPPTVIVKEAFDAFTGLDDSTQMAVTNVFGVIENMIEHFEKENPHKPEDKKPVRNQNQNQDHSPPQEGSPENDKGSGFGKQKQVPTVSSTLIVSSMNILKCIDVAERSGDAGEKKHDFSKNQVQHQIDETQMSHEVNYNASEVKDGVIQGMEKQSANAIKQDGKESQMISVSPNTIKHMDNFPWQAKVNDLETFLCPSVKYPPLTNSKMDYTSIESTNDLFLEYVPEEGQWKLLDQIGSISDSVKVGSQHDSMKVNGPKKNSPSGKDMPMHIIEPSYIILDTQIASDELIEESTLQKSILQEIEQETKQTEDLLNVIKGLIVNVLRLEVSRRLEMSHIKALGLDLEEELSIVANAVALAVKQDIQRSGKAMPHETENLKHLNNCTEAGRSKFTILHGEHIVGAISSVLRDTSVLGKLIPVGVVVGAILAALRPVFFVVTGEKDLFDAGNEVDYSVPCSDRTGKVKGGLSREEVGSKFDDLTETYKQQEPMHDEKHQNKHARRIEKNIEVDGRAMVGAMTAAFGVTAALASHEMNKNGLFKGNEHVEATIDSGLECTNKGQLDVTNDKNVDETGNEKIKPNIVSSLAERAMSVAAPVVPTKKDGEVDHERLVAVLADLGQKGGALRLVGKAALLWGGLRGAMSLTDRLIMFLRLAERPLHQRLLGFFCMALLLWSPVVVPLLPTLLQLWTLHLSPGVAGLASIIGLYAAVIILITIWGRRIRGYEQPLEQYGLSISSVSKILNLSSGMTIGSVLVISLYAAYIFLGYATFTLKPEFSFSLSKGFVPAIKSCGRISRLVIHAFGMGLAISTIEELLFRSWLHEEITSDLGFHKAVVLSGIIFSSLHWSLPVMPGLWLLSVALSGARAKGNGDLALPIGLHAALITGNFIMQSGGFIRYNSNAPGWLTGSYVGHPFGGVLGLSSVAILALLLYPWNGDEEARKLHT